MTHSITRRPYIFNPAYRLRNDKNRAIIYLENKNDLHNDNFLCFLHPLIAILLSMFDGKSKTSKIINDFSYMTSLKNTVVRKILGDFLFNKEVCCLDFDSFRSIIPKKTIVPANGRTRSSGQAFEEFLVPHDKLDCQSKRLNIPLDLILEINFNCMTDCIYCYADRSNRNYRPLPLKRILELIEEARKLGMRSFDFSGGELFLYKDWETVLGAIVENGFRPIIPTKVPISRETMLRLKNIGIDSLQLSLDSIIPTEMKQILSVDDDYCRAMLACLDNLAQLGFKIHINSQMTRLNEDSVEDLLKYLLNYHKQIKRISIGATGFSLYKGADAFLSFRPSLNAVNKANKIIAKYSNNEICKDISIFMGEFPTVQGIQIPLEEKSERFKKRASCSGNFSGFVVLPDGKVTICEELYWHPQFIIGDLAVQSIEEAWNSKRALELYHFNKLDFRKESACSNCPDDEFVACHKNQGICWRDNMKAYGPGNWDFPDYRCPAAPPPMNTYWIE